MEDRLDTSLPSPSTHLFLVSVNMLINLARTTEKIATKITPRRNGCLGIQSLALSIDPFDCCYFILFIRFIFSVLKEEKKVKNRRFGSSHL